MGIFIGEEDYDKHSCSLFAESYSFRLNLFHYVPKNNNYYGIMYLSHMHQCIYSLLWDLQKFLFYSNSLLASALWCNLWGMLRLNFFSHLQIAGEFLQGRGKRVAPGSSVARSCYSMLKATSQFWSANLSRLVLKVTFLFDIKTNHFGSKRSFLALYQPILSVPVFWKPLYFLTN